jgi:hypothetical protein
MQRQIAGLGTMVREELGRDPQSGVATERRMQIEGAIAVPGSLKGAVASEQSRILDEVVALLASLDGPTIARNPMITPLEGSREGHHYIRSAGRLRGSLPAGAPRQARVARDRARIDVAVVSATQGAIFIDSEIRGRRQDDYTLQSAFAKRC